MIRKRRSWTDQQILPQKNTEDETEEGLYERWRTEFGDEGAATIQRTVAASLPHYLHMKEFCMRIR